jgi:large subunit ribosomal protein L7/L12
MWAVKARGNFRSEKATIREIEMSEVIDQIIDSIDKLTVMELAELSKALQEKYGVSAAMPVAAAAAPGAAAGAGEAEEEKTEFDVVLDAVGDKKIQVIKVVRELTSLGLKEAKELVDGAPSKVKEGVTKEDAEAAKAKLEEVGATIKIQ